MSNIVFLYFTKNCIHKFRSYGFDSLLSLWQRMLRHGTNQLHEGKRLKLLGVAGPKAGVQYIRPTQRLGNK